MTGRRTGPLAGLRVVELASIGPVPFAATMLADMGADVLRVERPGGIARPGGEAQDFTRRSRRTVALDLTSDEGRSAALRLIEHTDVLLEGHRPGVAERLGLGPDTCRERNPRLVYGRMTGWGQRGPLAQSAGHDINYLSVTGALNAIGERARPSIPLNLVADYGGGAMFLVAGVLAARLRARETGLGDVVDAGMVDGVITLTGVMQGMRSSGIWRDERESNILDGGLPWYSVYQTSDGGWMAVGALEPKFFAEFCTLLPLEATEAERADPSTWPAMRDRIADRFREDTRAAWTALFHGTDACVSPVLSFGEAADHPHIRARGSLIEREGIVEPAPAPRFASGEAEILPDGGFVTEDAVLADWAPHLRP